MVKTRGVTSLAIALFFCTFFINFSYCFKEIPPKSPTTIHTKARNTGKHFVLVHGACHGAWCWYEVVTLLRSAGHRVTALDLAASGINSTSLDEIHTVSELIYPLLSFMAALPQEDKVVLVGHSWGGVAISVAMERFPHKVSVGVFVTAFMPSPDLALEDIDQEFKRQLESYMDSKVTFDHHKRPTSLLLGPKFLSTQLYQLSPPKDLTLALLSERPFPYFYDAESSKTTTMTKENYGSIPKVFIVCGQDKVIKEKLQRWMIKNNPPDEVRVISDSDHMAMFSKAPELSFNLHVIAEKY